MDQEIIKHFEDRGLSAGFLANSRGQVFCGRDSASMQSEIAQMATVIFETIGAVGDLSIDRIQIIGKSRGVVAEINKDRIIGSILDGDERDSAKRVFASLDEIKGIEVPVASAVVEPEPAVDAAKAEAAVEEPVEQAVEEGEKPEAVTKPKIRLDAGILETMKSILKDYVGDFADRIFNNQMKAQRIKSEALHDEDARRLIFALGKAAGMIIGPSKGRDMTNKLLALLK